MPGAPRPHLTDDERSAILADLYATQGTPDGALRKVAARHGRALSTISAIAAKAGMVEHVGRSSGLEKTGVRMAAATHAENCKQRRMAASARAAEVAVELGQLLIDELRGQAGVTRHERNERRERDGALVIDGTMDYRRLSMAFAAVVSTHLNLEGIDTDSVNPAMVDRFNEHMLTAGDD